MYNVLIYIFSYLKVKRNYLKINFVNTDLGSKLFLLAALLWMHFYKIGTFYHFVPATEHGNGCICTNETHLSWVPLPHL